MEPVTVHHWLNAAVLVKLSCIEDIAHNQLLRDRFAGAEHLAAVRIVERQLLPLGGQNHNT